MVKQSKVKSYVRNGKTVKSYNRSIKDAVRQVGSAIGAGLGGGLNYYLAKRRQKQALNSK
jgi:hypothetical protein